MKCLKLTIVCVILCCQSFIAQISNAKLQWKRNTHGIAYEDERAIKAYRDPATGSTFVLYQGRVNYGVTKFDNSGASVMNFKRREVSMNPTYGNDFIKTGSSGLLICGKKGFYGNIMKITTNGDSVWEYTHTLLPAYTWNVSSFSCLTELLNGSIVAGGDKGDTAFICSVSSAGNLNWQRTYTPANYSRGVVLGIQTDNFNNIYTCGSVKNNAGNYDAFVSVFNPSGTLLWERFIQGAAGANDSATKILVDISGNVYVGGTIKDSSATNNSTFLVKYNASGGLQYLKKFHQSGQINATLGGINYDASGNVALASNSYRHADTSVVYVQKFNMSGNPQWTTSYASNYSFVHNENSAAKVAFDGFGNICVSGTTRWHTGMAFISMAEMFLLKLNTSGTLVWSKIYDNPSNTADCAVDLLTDNSGNSYLVGYSGSAGFAPVNTTVVKYSSAGVLQWEGIFDSPGNLNDDVKQMILSGNSVYTLGVITNQGSGLDLVINKYNNLGTLLWQVVYDDGGYSEQAHGMVMDNQKNIYVLATNNNSVLLKYDSLGTLIWTRSYPPADGFYSGITMNPSQQIYLVNSSGPGNMSNYTDGEFIARKVDLNGSTIYQASPVPGNRNFSQSTCKANAAGELFVFGAMRETNLNFLHITKYNSAGTVDWGYDIPGLDSSQYLVPSQIEFDAAGNLILFANVKSVANPTMHFCLLKVSPTGTVIWRNDYVPSASDHYVWNGFHLDSYGALWIVDTNGPPLNLYKFNQQNGNLISSVAMGNWPEALNTGQLVRRYKQNELLIVAAKDFNKLALIKTDTLGNRIWIQEYSGFDVVPVIAKGIDFDQQGRIYIAANSIEQEGGQPDIVLLKYCDLPVPSISTSGTFQNLCPGNPVTLTASAGTTYLWNPSNTTQQTFSTDTTAAAYAFVYESDGCYQSTDTVMVTRKAVPTTPSICAVTVDSLSTHNIIAWDKTGINGATAFNIYREDVTNVYSYIATVPYDSLSEYHDYGANPNVTTKRYKISAIDSCGQESDLSLYHNTIYIVSNGTGQFSWNIRYTIEPNTNPVANYVLMREDIAFSGIWNQVAITAGTQYNINDLNYASFPNGRWRVETIWTISCLPTRGAINTSRSNVKSPTSVGLQTLTTMEFSMSPNPANNQVTIRTGKRDGKSTVKIYNTLGQLVIAQPLESAETVVNIESLEAGAYFVQIAGTQNSTMKKLIKY